MQYSEQFKKEVLFALGDSKELRKILDEGQEIVGRYLDDARQGGIPAKEIVDACESMNFQEIYLKAKREMLIEKLYKEWLELYRNQHQGMHK